LSWWGTAAHSRPCRCLSMFRYSFVQYCRCELYVTPHKSSHSLTHKSTVFMCKTCDNCFRGWAVQWNRWST
jgi:hypothetical protein